MADFVEEHEMSVNIYGHSMIPVKKGLEIQMDFVVVLKLSSQSKVSMLGYLSQEVQRSLRQRFSAETAF